VQDVSPSARAEHGWETVCEVNRNAAFVLASSKWGRRITGAADLDGVEAARPVWVWVDWGTVAVL
jgi:hypothetical protein